MEARLRPRPLTRTVWSADANGGLWMTDPLGIRYLGRDGIINRIAGGSDYGFAGDDQSANPNTLYNYPAGIALNSSGEVIIADTHNSRIRKLQPNDPARMDVVSGNNQTGTTGTALNAFVVKLTGKAGVAPGWYPGHLRRDLWNREPFYRHHAHRPESGRPESQRLRPRPARSPSLPPPEPSARSSPPLSRIRSLSRHPISR